MIDHEACDAGASGLVYFLAFPERVAELTPRQIVALLAEAEERREALWGLARLRECNELIGELRSALAGELRRA